MICQFKQADFKAYDKEVSALNAIKRADLCKLGFPQIYSAVKSDSRAEILIEVKLFLFNLRVGAWVQPETSSETVSKQ